MACHANAAIKEAVDAWVETPESYQAATLMDVDTAGDEAGVAFRSHVPLPSNTELEALVLENRRKV